CVVHGCKYDDMLSRESAQTIIPHSPDATLAFWRARSGPRAVDVKGGVSTLDTDHGVCHRQKILITGGSGTLGYNILRRLAADERYHVVAPVRNIKSLAVQTLSGKVQLI